MTVIQTQTTTSDAAERGAFITTKYAGREIQVLAVFRSELRAISSLNAQATVFYSVSSALVGFALAIWINAVFYTQLAPAAIIAVWIIAPTFLGLAIVFYFLGRNASEKRASALQEIEDQTLSS